MERDEPTREGCRRGRGGGPVGRVAIHVGVLISAAPHLKILTWCRWEWSCDTVILIHNEEFSLKCQCIEKVKEVVGEEVEEMEDFTNADCEFQGIQKKNFRN